MAPPTILKWPFKCPAMQFTQVFKLPLRRMEFVNGNARQRRITRSVPTRFQLKWVASQEEASHMADWLVANAVNWFEIKLPGVVAGLYKEQLYPQAVRLISDISTDVIATSSPDGFYMEISGEFESVLINIGTGSFPYFKIGTWIVAAHPSAPSSGLVTAGTATSPTAGQVHAGSPSTPYIVI